MDEQAGQYALGRGRHVSGAPKDGLIGPACFYNCKRLPPTAAHLVVVRQHSRFFLLAAKMILSIRTLDRTRTRLSPAAIAYIPPEALQGSHLVHTDEELAGADVLAKIAPSWVERCVNMAVAVPALERAFEIYARHNKPIAQQLHLRSLLQR